MGLQNVCKDVGSRVLSRQCPAVQGPMKREGLLIGYEDIISLSILVPLLEQDVSLIVRAFGIFR